MAYSAYQVNKFAIPNRSILNSSQPYSCFFSLFLSLTVFKSLSFKLDLHIWGLQMFTCLPHTSTSTENIFLLLLI